MNKEEARLLFMDYMYGELEAAQEEELLHFINQHKDLKTELEELTETKSLLQHLPVHSPKEQLVIMEPKNDSGESWWKSLIEMLVPSSTVGRTGLGLVAALFLFIVTAALTDMNMSIKDGGFTMAFGELPTVQQGFTPEQVQLIVDRVQQENANMINQIVTDAQVQQNLLMEETLAGFASYLEEQRTYDLQQISQGLNSLEQTTYNRFRQTDQVLGEIIESVSYGN